jgi:hypothetical protein
VSLAAHFAAATLYGSARRRWRLGNGVILALSKLGLGMGRWGGFGAWIRLRRLLRLSSLKYDDARRLRRGSWICFSQQEARRDIPVPSIGSNDGHRFALVVGQRAFDRTPLPIFKRYDRRSKI